MNVVVNQYISRNKDALSVKPRRNYNFSKAEFFICVEVDSKEFFSLKVDLSAKFPLAKLGGTVPCLSIELYSQPSAVNWPNM